MDKIDIGYMIQNQIRLDTTLIFGLEAILQGYRAKGQIIFSSFLMSHRFELLKKITWTVRFASFIYYLQ